MALLPRQKLKSTCYTRSTFLHILRNLIVLLLSLQSSYGSALTTADFKWEAGVDTQSGLAYSLERSRTTSTINFDGSIGDVISKCKKEFMDYPQFLARRNVMFGLLRANKSSRDESGQSLTTMICDPILNMNLLSFGVPSINVTPLSRSNKIRQYCVLAKIPIVGGLLVSTYNNKEKSQFKTTKVSSKRHIGEKYGEIWLQLTLSERLRKVVHEQNDCANIQMETRVVDYRPSIAGMPPIGNVRRFLYRHTQSYLHAYVMWKFHNHCYKNICK